MMVNTRVSVNPKYWALQATIPKFKLKYKLDATLSFHLVFLSVIPFLNRGLISTKRFTAERALAAIMRTTKKPTTG
jgi:hypothetical protein